MTAEPRGFSLWNSQSRNVKLLHNLFSAKRYSKSPGQISKEAVLNSDSSSYLLPFDFIFWGRGREARIMKEIQVLCSPLSTVSCA